MNIIQKTLGTLAKTNGATHSAQWIYRLAGEYGTR